MPPDSPTGFQSFADWLGLNQQSLDELEAQASQRALAKSAEAEGALGASYQEALRNAETGGDASLSGTASYGDFLRLQREAKQQRARVGMSREEFGASEFADGPEMPDLNARASQLQGQASQRGAGRRTDAETAAAMKRQQDEARAAQDKAFGVAKSAVLGQVGGQQRRAQYFGSQQSSWSADEQVKQDAANQGYGSPGAYRQAIDQKYKNITNAGKR